MGRGSSIGLVRTRKDAEYGALLHQFVRWIVYSISLLPHSPWLGFTPEGVRIGCRKLTPKTVKNRRYHHPAPATSRTESRNAMSTNDTASEVDLSESRQGELRTTVYSITILAAVFVALRFAARVQRGATFGIDDWMLVVALVRIRLPQ